MQDQGGPGIHFVIGYPRKGGGEVQSVRFDTARYDVKQARAWLRAHGFKATGLEAAKPAKAKPRRNPAEANLAGPRAAVVAAMSALRDAGYTAQREPDGWVSGHGANSDFRIDVGVGTSRAVVSVAKRRAGKVGDDAWVSVYDVTPVSVQDTAGVRTAVTLAAAWIAEKSPRRNPAMRTKTVRPQRRPLALRRNPPGFHVEVNPAVVKAQREYEAAHWGIAPKHVFEVADRDIPKTLVQMGFLKELHVKPAHGGKYRLTFSKPSSVAYDPTGLRHLFLVLTPKDQRDIAAIRAKLRVPADDMLGEVADEVGGRQADWRYPALRVAVLGTCTHVVYATHKKGDGPSDYIHELGEDRGGIKPALCVDQAGRLWLAGGSYKVEHRGIVN